MPRVIRVRYEKGILKPLTKLNLKEGREYNIILEENVDELIKRYRGVLGKSSVNEYWELEEEAQAQ